MQFLFHYIYLRYLLISIMVLYFLYFKFPDYYVYFAALHRVYVIIVIFKSLVLINLNGYFHLEIVNIVLS